MKRISQHILLWLVSLSILNTSIDVMDESFAFPLSSSSAPQYQEIESIAELLMDTAMDQSLPDHKGNDQNGIIKKAASFDFFISEKKEKFTTGFVQQISSSEINTCYTIHLSPGYRTILTPPPNSIV